MTEAPEQIWAWEYKGNSPWGPIKPDLNVVTNGAEYIRKDVSDALVAAAREQALRDAAHVATEYGEQQYSANVEHHPKYADDAQEDGQEIARLILAITEKKNPGNG